MERITMEHLERAERALRSRAAATVEVNALNIAIAERFGMAPEDVAEFVELRFLDARRQYFSGMDPRHEQHVAVLMRHCLLVGAGAGKISEGKD